MSDNSQYPSHEEVEFRRYADALGPEIANSVFQTPAGGPSFYELYGNKQGQNNYPQNTQPQNFQNQGGSNMDGFSGNNREWRFVREQSQEFQSGNNAGSQLNNSNQGSQGYNQGYQNQGYNQGNQGFNQGNQGFNQGYQGNQGFQGGYGEPKGDGSLHSRLPKVYGKAIVATAKDGRGNILAFKLEDNTVLNYDQMMTACDQGAVQGLRVQGNREGELIIRSVPDGYTDNNLDNLPTFS